MNEVTIYLVKTSFIKENLSYVSNFVDKNRLKKANRYVNEKDRLLSLGAALLMKKYLRNKEIKENENGKPHISGGPFFNVSHSGEYSVIAIQNEREVGIDIQLINEDKLDAIEYVLSEKEKHVIDSNTLFQVWTNKESLIKCTSNGLKDIKKVSGLPLEGNRTIDNEEYYTKSLILGKYALSLTLKGKEPFEMVIKQVDTLD